jgi:hypothetical protein
LNEFRNEDGEKKVRTEDGEKKENLDEYYEKLMKKYNLKKDPNSDNLNDKDSISIFCYGSNGVV